MILRTTERCAWQTAEPGIAYSPKTGLVRTCISQQPSIIMAESQRKLRNLLGHHHGHVVGHHHINVIGHHHGHVVGHHHINVIGHHHGDLIGYHYEDVIDPHHEDGIGQHHRDVIGHGHIKKPATNTCDWPAAQRRDLAGLWSTSSWYICACPMHGQLNM